MNRFRVFCHIPCLILLFALTSGMPSSSRAELQWTVYTDPTELRSIAVSDGAVWAAGRGGLVRQDRQSGAFSTLTTADGLPINELNAVLAAADGEIWLGTAGAGLLRYRPADVEPWQRIKTFPQGLASDWVNCLHEDPDGRLWYGGDGGFGVVEGITPGNVWTALDGLVSEDVFGLAFHGDTLYVGTGAGFYSLDSDGNLAPDTEVSGRVDAVVTLADWIWIIENGSVRQRPVTGGGWSTLTLPLSEHDAQAMIAAGGLLYVSLNRNTGSEEQNLDSVFSYDPIGESWTDLSSGLPETPPSRYHQPDYIALAADGEGELWTAGRYFNGTGLGLLHRDGGNWTHHPLNNHPLGPDITSMALAAGGRLWTGSGAGAAYLEDGVWQRKRPDPQLCDWRHPYFPHGLLEDSEGWVWFSGWSEPVARWHLETGVEECAIPDQSFFIRIAEDTGGNRWFLSDDQLPVSAVDVYDTDGVWHGFGPGEGLPGNAADDVAFIDEERAALLFRGVGLCVWDTRGTLETEDDVWYLPSSEEGDTIIYDPGGTLHTDTGGFSVDVGPAGTIWVGQGNGLVRVVPSSEGYEVEGRLGVQTAVSPGLLMTQTRDVATAPDGSVWVGTGFGLTRAAYDDESGTWSTEHWTSEEGRALAGPDLFEPEIVSPLPHYEVRKVAVGGDGDTVFVGTANGIVELAIVADPPAPPEAVESAWLYPNPVRLNLNHSDVKLEGVAHSVQVTVYNLEGQLVTGPRAVGKGEVAWDLRTRFGSLAASGVYLIRLEDRGAVSVKTLVLIR